MGYFGVNPDFLVIGAGVIGLASAWELASTGASIVVIDRGQPGREASWAGGGILHALLPWDYREEVIALIAHSIDIYRDWVDAIRAGSAIDPEYAKTGVLVLPPFDETRARCWASERRIALQIVLPEAVVPDVRSAEPALWLSDVAQVRNPRLIHALVEALKRRGVNIVAGEEVQSLQVSDNAVTRVDSTNGSSWMPGSAIVTAGAWSGCLLGQLSWKLDIFPVRGQMLLYKLVPGRLKTIVLQNEHYVIPRLDGHILVGSTKEHVGFDSRTTQTGRQELEKAAARLFPPLGHLSPIAHWAGLRPGSPDNIPTIARHPRIKNLYVNAGHYRYGLTMAPGSARLLANLILGRDQPIDVSPYNWPVENVPN